MKKVNFTEMKKGTKEDYVFLDKLEKEYVGETADRILSFLSRMTSTCLLYTSPSPRDRTRSRMPSSA